MGIARSNAENAENTETQMHAFPQKETKMQD